MWQKDRMKLILPSKQNPCLKSFVVVTHFFTILATLIIGVQLLTLSIGMKLHALIDLRLLEQYLTNDSTILLGVSIFVILCGSFGLISTIQKSYAGTVTTLAILVTVLGFTDMYLISGQRVKNYVFPNDLHNTLHAAIITNPFENFALHFMQNKLSCCGAYNYMDWVNTIGVIPGSCCGSPTICDIADQTWNKQGCMGKIQTILTNTYENTISVIVALNIIGIIEIFTGYFYSHLLREPKEINQNFYGAIPRIPAHNLIRSQSSGQPLHSAYARPTNVQPGTNPTTPTAPATIYPNLYLPDAPVNNNGNF